MMIHLYYNLVINKKRTCNPENKDVRQVPESLQKEVLALLTERGYDADGNPVA